jgi:phosphoribosylformylglycinamidine synthase
VFLSGVDELELPVAHGEGKFVPRDQAILDSLQRAGQLVLKYQLRSRAGSSSTPSEKTGGRPTLRVGARAPARQSATNSVVPYPDNPNGSVDDVAGICDATGRVFGLMPHPERFVDPTQHPTWTRGPKREVGEGLRMFQNAVRYFR